METFSVPEINGNLPRITTVLGETVIYIYKQEVFFQLTRLFLDWLFPNVNHQQYKYIHYILHFLISSIRMHAELPSCVYYSRAHPVINTFVCVLSTIPSRSASFNMKAVSRCIHCSLAVSPVYILYYYARLAEETTSEPLCSQIPTIYLRIIILYTCSFMSMYMAMQL